MKVSYDFSARPDDAVVAALTTTDSATAEVTQDAEGDLHIVIDNEFIWSAESLYELAQVLITVANSRS
jgi:hypothetical protein